jgi:hypothetical protein
MKLLGAFKPLKIRPGWVLRAFQFKAGGNGNAVVFAVEGLAPSLPPGEVVPGPVLPEGALGNPMEAIVGDGTPWSYLFASLLARELGEFGAQWHGCEWSTHTILGASMEFDDGGGWRAMRPTLFDKQKWTWVGTYPREGNPHVVVGPKYTTVRFMSFTALGQQAIVLNEDRYTPGRYASVFKGSVIAKGPGGYIF